MSNSGQQAKHPDLRSAGISGKKLIESALLARLSDPELVRRIIDPVIERAENGELSAFCVIRDSIGEKPAPNNGASEHHVEVTLSQDITGYGE